MANLPESASFDAGIYQIETTDPVLGGVDGISNSQAKGLANRTTWLKQQVDALNALKGKGIGAFSAANSYSGGDQVIYQKNIWQANTAITPGAFNPGNWTRQLGVAAESALANALPLVNGAAAVGTSTDLAREDHVHPVDTSRAPLASPALTGNPTAPTAAQFDNDTSIATTEFVQRALGSRAGALDVSNGAFGDATYYGKILNIGAGSSYLPDIDGSVNGVTLHYKNTGLGVHTLSRVGSDLISCDGSSITSITVGKGEELTLVRVNNIWIGSGSAALKYAAGFSASLATIGYQKLPSGLIIQWGSAGISAVSPVTVYLPIAFPNAIYGVYPVAALNVGENPSSTTLAGAEIASRTLSNFVLRTSNPSARTCEWFAIGY